MEKDKMPQYQIREATMDDIENIRRMHAQSWLDTYPNEKAGISYEWVKEATDTWLTPEGLEKSREHFRGVFGNPDHFYRIATDGDRVIGLVHGLEQDGHKHLGALYVDKGYHGTGVAQRLMDQVDTWFGDDEVDLEVVAYNERAKAFYRKYGFVESDKVNELFEGRLPNVTMIRKGGRQ